VLHEDLHVVQQCQDLVSTWLKPRGLELKPSKTRITHTLAVSQGSPGFDFLGFHVRHHPAGKTKSGKDCRGRLHGFKTRITPSKAALQRHVHDLRGIVHRHRHAEQSTLIQRLNLGAIPTTRIAWDQPHEGNMFEFLYKRRAIERKD